MCIGLVLINVSTVLFIIIHIWIVHMFYSRNYYGYSFSKLFLFELCLWFLLANYSYCICAIVKKNLLAQELSEQVLIMGILLCFQLAVRLCTYETSLLGCYGSYSLHTDMKNCIDNLPLEEPRKYIKYITSRICNNE